MALTPEQESYLAALADRGIADAAYNAKLADLAAARTAVNNAVAFKYTAGLTSPDGAVQKQAIAALRAEIEADPIVIQLAAELAAMPKPTP